MGVYGNQMPYHHALKDFVMDQPAEGQDQKRHSRMRRWSILLATITIGICLLYAARQHHPALELYVSPPIDAEGHRLQVLKPYGWQPLDVKQETFSVPSDMICLQPPEPPRWLPKFLHRFMGYNEEEMNHEMLTITFTRDNNNPPGDVQDAPAYIIPLGSDNQILAYQAANSRHVKNGPYMIDCVYLRERLDTLQKTQVDVLASVDISR